MHKMKFFIDVHDTRSSTFPADIRREDFAGFFRTYEEAARELGVVVLRVHVGFGEGRAWCFNMAPDAEAVRRVHEKVGLPFESITEVSTATPGDLYFAPDAAP